jgi:hypothetical protein
MLNVCSALLHSRPTLTSPYSFTDSPSCFVQCCRAHLCVTSALVFLFTPHIDSPFSPSSRLQFPLQRTLQRMCVALAFSPPYCADYFFLSSAASAPAHIKSTISLSNNGTSWRMQMNIPWIFRLFCPTTVLAINLLDIG